MFSWLTGNTKDSTQNEKRRRNASKSRSSGASSGSSRRNQDELRAEHDAKRSLADAAYTPVRREPQYNDGVSSSIFAASTVKSVNKSVIHSAVSRSVVASSSRFALSAFSYEINAVELDIAISKLREIDLDVQAVWVVSRPITRAGMGANTFEHWAVKVYTELVLLDMDFYELDGFGAFGCAPICASWAELSDFLHYYVRDNDSGTVVKKKWQIIASVVPERVTPPSHSSHSSLHSDENDLVHLSSLMEDEVRPVRCDKKINDICEFLDQWSATKQSYHSVLNNCQRFAFDLFDFLVGEDYPDRVQMLSKRLQSPYDRVAETQREPRKNTSSSTMTAESRS